MSTRSAATRRPLTWRSGLRRTVGWILLGAAAAGAVLFVLGSWNPWRLVVLEYRFGNPALGAGVVLLAAFVGHWLALPIRNEVRQGGRMVTRVTLGVLLVIGLFMWGLFGLHFTFDVWEAARSPDGERAVAIVSDRDRPVQQRAKLWTGSGLTARELADLGQVCGPTEVRFLTDDRIELDTSYGTWQIDLDPATGTPRQVLGPHCADGPVPATLGA